MHPGAAERLVDELVDAAHRMQVVFTTHSPDLVALVPVDSLRVVEATDEGTKIGTSRNATSTRSTTSCSRRAT